VSIYFSAPRIDKELLVELLGTIRGLFFHDWLTHADTPRFFAFSRCEYGGENHVNVTGLGYFQSLPNPPGGRLEDVMVEQASSHKRIAWVVRELKSFAGIVLYLWVVFGLYVLNETIIMGKEHISFASHGFALINAVVLGKVLLVAEDMNFADGFKQGPLVFPIVYKAFAFAVLFVGFHVAESVLVGLFHGQGPIKSFPAIGGGTPKGILCVIAILFVSLLPFFAFREVGRVIGEDRLWALLFKRGAVASEFRSAQG
jgi:hypothetical protein